MSADDATTRHRGALAAPLLAGVGVAYALLVARFWFVCDDAWISFRYARHLADGLGLRFNPGAGPPVEGYSNFLWVMAAAGVEWVGGDVSWWMPLLSATCGAALLVCVFDRLRRIFGVEPSTAALATLSLALFPPFALWSTGGLATLPFSLCLFLAFDELVLRRGAPRVGRSSVLALCTALLRVEGILWVAVVAALALVRRRLGDRHAETPPASEHRAFLGIGLIVVAGFAGYEIWRIATFGDWIPNTVRAKAALTPDLLTRGYDYVLLHFLTFLTPALLIPATVVALRSARRARGATVAAMAWAFPVYAVLTTGDFMAMGRFLVPGAPFLALLWGAWLAEMRRPVALVAGLAAVIVGLLPAFDIHLVPESVRARHHFRHNTPTYRSEIAQWQYMRDNERAWRRLGSAVGPYARRTWGDDATMVATAIGAVGYHSQLDILDEAGLVTREVTERDVHGGRLRSPGHDRQVGAWFFLDRHPSILRATWLEAEDAAGLAKAAQDSASQLRYAAPEREAWTRYAPHLERVEAGVDVEASTGFIVWQRIPEGVAWEDAWDEFDLKLAELGGAHPDERPPAPDGARSAVLIVVDTLRFDHVGAYADTAPRTHNMDLLASTGARFARAYSPAPWTKPSVASLLTGLYPSGHGAQSVDAGLPASVVTVAERLRQRGWATGAVTSGSFVTRQHGLDQGFDVFDEQFVRGHAAITSRQITERALAIANDARRKGRPYFLLVHYFDAHYAYRDHPGIELASKDRGRVDESTSIHTLREWAPTMTGTELAALRALYREEVVFVDGAIGRLMQGLLGKGGDPDTLVMLTSDHGEELAERGWIGHTRSLYEELLRVPLLVRAPGLVPAGVVVEAPVSTVAVAATLLDLLDVAPDDPGFQAQSLRGYLEGGAPATPDPVLGEVDFRPTQDTNTAKTAFKKAWIGPRYKLVLDDPTGDLELYDLSADPLELDDLADREPARAEALRADLEARLDALRANAPTGAALEIDAAERARLRELGYLDD